MIGGGKRKPRNKVSPFKERRRRREGRKKGIKSYADLSITKDDIVATFDAGDHVWDESKISSRTTSLTKEVLNLWKLHFEHEAACAIMAPAARHCKFDTHKS